MGSRLVMVAGSGWGAGKTTLASALAEGLRKRSGRVSYLSEDDLLGMEGFAAFERQLGPADPETNPADRTLLAATRGLLEDAPDDRTLLVTDAILPGFFWLLGRYSRERVRAYADELAGLLRPHDPLLVYLRGEARTLLDRAVATRGREWLARVPGWVTRWRVPHYPDGPLRDLGDVVRLWEWLHAQTIEVLADWPVESLVLDAMAPPEDLVRTVLECLGGARSSESAG